MLYVHHMGVGLLTLGSQVNSEGLDSVRGRLGGQQPLQPLVFPPHNNKGRPAVGSRSSLKD